MKKKIIAALLFGMTWVLVAVAKESREELWQQKEALLAAVQTEPQNAEFWMRLGLINRDLEEWDGALTAFRKAVEIDPKVVRAYYLIALICEKRMKEDPSYKTQAIQAWENCLKFAEDSKIREVAQKHLRRLKNQ
ncbi:MAG: tetratricopeptide repeat protein [Elusimicrobia bacterium]|nr:tetratricopeptide repeat protein [Elusimicrobiota bacterium]